MAEWMRTFENKKTLREKRVREYLFLIS